TGVDIRGVEQESSARGEERLESESSRSEDSREGRWIAAADDPHHQIDRTGLGDVLSRGADGRDLRGGHLPALIAATWSGHSASPTALTTLCSGGRRDLDRRSLALELEPEEAVGPQREGIGRGTDRGELG